MARRLIPLLDRVLIEKVQPVTKSAGGILLPESAVSKINEGIVVSVGPGRRTVNGDLIPPSVKEGDKVLLPEYGGNSVKLAEKEDEEILGVLSHLPDSYGGAVQVDFSYDDLERLSSLTAEV